MGLRGVSAHSRGSEPFQAWMWTNAQKSRFRLLKWALLILIPCAVFLVFPRTALDIALLLSSTFVVFMAGLRLTAILITAHDHSHADLDLSADPPTQPTQWPRFTVLVPLFREAHMVKSLMDNLSKIDYPEDRIDIILVTEADDIATCRAVKHNLRPPFQIFEVPPSQPRTKPKALNAALAAIPPQKRGDIITVYDAEDRPHPGQLKQAALALMADPGLAAVQAPLGYYNDRDNLLTTFFGLEYAALFHVWNPALAKLGLPFTFGGTSNHIRKTVLEAVGGWDACNVTEDADLSFRITAMNYQGRGRGRGRGQGQEQRQRQGLKIGIISLPTNEEAVSSYKNWTAQRSRWLKGFMQTWRVHMRHYKTAPDGGHFHMANRIRNMFSLQITVGATLLSAYLHVPSLIIMTMLYITSLTSAYSLQHPLLFLSVLLGGYGAAILSAMIGARRAGKLHLVKFSVLMPFYWLMHFIPVLMASREILVAPDYWRKTTHKGTNPIPKRTKEQTLEPVNAPLI